MLRRKRLIQSRRTYKDSTPDESLQAGRAGASEQDADLFDIKEGAPLVPRELQDLARHINSRCIDREEDFITFDYHLCRLSHARSLIDLCLGELLSAFRKADGKAYGKAYGEMGYSRLDDFADEHLSFSGRLASEMILNYERLQALPLTREAYIKGDIVKSALRMLLRVTTKENEAELLSEINGMSVREIDALVKKRLRTVKVCGREDDKAETDSAATDTEESCQPSDDQSSEEIPSEESDREEGSGVVMKFNVPRTLALTWDFALEHFRENDKTKGPLYGFVEALVSCFLDSTADLAASQEHASDAEPTDAAERECKAEPGANIDAGAEPECKAEPGADVDAGADAETEVGAEVDAGADAETEAGANPNAYSEACSEAYSEDCIDLDGESGEVSEDGPAFAGGREVPLLYTDAIWDCFPSEREMRAREREDSLALSGTGGCGSAEACGSGSAEPGCGKLNDSGDEYPNSQDEERLKQIREGLALQPFVVKLPEEYSQIPLDSYALARKIIRVASMRQSIDYHIGWFLKAIRDRYLFRIMEFSKIEDYAKARINISASTTFRLIRLVSYFKNHPVIEKAFLKRKITREQAYQIASLEDGRHEKIWLDFAMSRPARELRDEVNRMLRIKEYDYFAPHSYALLPGFRYITDDRYDALSDEMKDILRTGAWYQGPGSQWPLASNDEHFLDKDFADKVASESDTSRLSECAADSGESSDPKESSRLSKCAADSGESSDLTESFRLSKCATDPGEGSDQTESSRLSKCAADVETGSCRCRDGEKQLSDETLETVRALCTLPDKHRPAATLLLDVLESLGRKSDCDVTDTSVASEALAASGTDGCCPHRNEPAMSIRFFIPRGLYGVWNEAVRRYVSLISPDDGVELLINNEGVENFIALLLTEYLLTEKAHHKAAHNNKVLERDGYRCQVPGCSNRRNIHAHHLKFRSHGGCDGHHNLLSLCESPSMDSALIARPED